MNNPLLIVSAMDGEIYEKFTESSFKYEAKKKNPNDEVLQ